MGLDSEGGQKTISLLGAIFSFVFIVLSALLFTPGSCITDTNVQKQIKKYTGCKALHTSPMTHGVCLFIGFLIFFVVPVSIYPVSNNLTGSTFGNNVRNQFECILWNMLWIPMWVYVWRMEFFGTRLSKPGIDWIEYSSYSMGCGLIGARGVGLAIYLILSIVGSLIAWGLTYADSTSIEQEFQPYWYVTWLFIIYGVHLFVLIGMYSYAVKRQSQLITDLAKSGRNLSPEQITALEKLGSRTFNYLLYLDMLFYRYNILTNKNSLDPTKDADLITALNQPIKNPFIIMDQNDNKILPAVFGNVIVNQRKIKGETGQEFHLEKMTGGASASEKMLQSFFDVTDEMSEGRGVLNQEEIEQAASLGLFRNLSPKERKDILPGANDVKLIDATTGIWTREQTELMTNNLVICIVLFCFAFSDFILLTIELNNSAMIWTRIRYMFPFFPAIFMVYFSFSYFVGVKRITTMGKATESIEHELLMDSLGKELCHNQQLSASMGLEPYIVRVARSIGLDVNKLSKQNTLQQHQLQ